MPPAHNLVGNKQRRGCCPKRKLNVDSTLNAVKFACPKCSTRYNIADDKVPPNKTLRFTCKKCSHVVRLRRKAKAAPAATVVAAAAVPAAGAFGGGEDSTRIANLNEIVAMRKRSAESGDEAAPAPAAAPKKAAPRKAAPKKAAPKKVEPAPAAPSTPFAGQDEWFVLISGKQEGPLTGNQVRGMLEQQKIDQRTYAWREGMGDWLRLAGVDEFADALDGDADWRVVKPVAKAKPAPQKVDQPPAFGTPGMEEPTAVVSMSDGGAAGHFQDKTENAFDASTADPFSQQTEERLRPSAGQLHDDEFTDDKFTDDGSTDIQSDGDFGSAQSPAFGGYETSDGYQDAPPGEATRVFMATAGIFKRRRQQRMAAIIGGASTLLLIFVVAGDISGLYEIPGMGLMYDMTGIQDTNVDRAIVRTEKKLAKSDLSPEEKAALRDKLLGLTTTQKKVGPTKKKSKKKVAVADPSGGIGIDDRKGSLSKDEKNMAFDIFNDDRKKSRTPQLKKVTQLQTPNLPDGLTQDSIFKVINDNTRSMSLCISQSMKAGEKLTGKMEVEMSIMATGRVSSASIETARFKSSTIGQCTVKTVKRWKFPRFNGEPVTVIFPYVLSAGF